MSRVTKFPEKRIEKVIRRDQRKRKPWLNGKDTPINSILGFRLNFSPDFRKKKFFQKKIFPRFQEKKFFQKKFFPRFQEKKIFFQKNFFPRFQETQNLCSKSRQTKISSVQRSETLQRFCVYFEIHIIFFPENWPNCFDAS